MVSLCLKIVHETGNMIKFRSGSLTRIKSNMPLKMLITNTKVGRNTKALVAGVSERTLRHPQAMASVFDAVDSISTELATIIQSSAPDDISVTERESKIEELMEMNQGLLQCMGVSHASIETILRTTLKYKLASKLTGAGGGGCVLTLLPTCILFMIAFIVVTMLLKLLSFICFYHEVMITLWFYGPEYLSLHFHVLLPKFFSTFTHALFLIILNYDIVYSFPLTI